MTDENIDEIFDEEIEEDNDDDVVLYHQEIEKKKKIQQDNQTQVNSFLETENLEFVNSITPSYYGELLAWALHQYLERKEWVTIKTLGYKDSQPIYTDIDTGKETVNLLSNGYLLIEKETSRFAVMVYINPKYCGYIQIQGPQEKKNELQEFIDGVTNIVKMENFYRGQTINFTGRINIIKPQGKEWNNIVIDDDVKKEIQANTTNFLRRSEIWSKCGIPLKRGIIIAGEPGVGKTIICKALISESDDVTCITTDPYAMYYDDYITKLYELAEDLKPSMVFIEDIDCIGQSRFEFFSQGQPALLTLLDVLDGVEDQSGVVTVATTNCLEVLDKALSERPSRFDRIIRLSRPSIEQRRKLIQRLSLKIPLPEDIQEYIARKSDNLTPAQIQEIVFSLVIQYPEKVIDDNNSITMDMVDKVLSRINSNFRPGLGFRINSGEHRIDSAFSVSQKENDLRTEHK